MTELITAIETSGYEYIGIRHLAEDEHYSIGDICRDSYDWDCDMDCSTYDTDEPISLGGTCAYNTRIQAGWDEKEEIIDQMFLIENLINQIPDAGAKTVLGYKYLQYLTFKEIAVKMNYSFTQIRRLHKRGIDLLNIL